MATPAQRAYNQQTPRIIAEQPKQPLSPTSWWINVDRKSFSAIAKHHRERMQRSGFSKNWTTE